MDAICYQKSVIRVLFAVEVLMHEVSARTLVPVALATTTATCVGRFLFGNTPAFPVPALDVPESLRLLPAYIGLGAVTAVASVLFIQTLYGTEDLFERVIPRHPYLRHVLGMQRAGASLAVVATRATGTSPGADRTLEIGGVVTKADLAEALAEGMELFRD
jgi:chloride channel protein, CIC family